MNQPRGTTTTMDEKQVMHRLNERFAGFIGTVHRLQLHNQVLEREIREIRGSEKPASRLEEECGPELRRLRRMVQDVACDKHQAEMDVGHMEEEVCRLRRQHEQEARRRSDAQSGVAVLRKDADDAQRSKLFLDQRAQDLAEEIQLMKRDHEAQVSDMLGQIRLQQQEAAEEALFGAPGVTAALRDIRAQLEGQLGTELQQVGESFRSHFARLTQAAESKREALRDSQQVAQERRRQLQASSTELDCAKGTREALERQLREVEDQHKEEIIHYQNTIKDLENELISCKFDMSGYMREYQDLLNVKMALDVEILSYRKLLCGEEARLSSMSDTHVSLPYIYHQSPVYTLPCLRRPGGPHRRVEPQYKFVEEIITETTREIEMSEFEDTGSDETETGRDEWECGKRERGGAEEEEEDSGEDKDGGEDRGEQMSDSQQNRPEVKSVNGGGDGDQRKTGEMEDGVSGDAKKEQVKDNMETERSREEEKVQLRKGCEDMKEERHDPERGRAAQEDEKPEKERSVKDDAHEDKFIPVQESDKRIETEGSWKKALDSSKTSEENSRGEEINKSEAANRREETAHDEDRDVKTHLETVSYSERKDLTPELTQLKMESLH